jgi:SAM-dependent methyltransferase
MKPIDAVCPCCGGRGLQQFYAVDSIPVNSCLIVPTRQRALTFPRGNLRIAFCEACGFITNTSFDLERLVYDETYEETQTFSPRFNEFQEALVRELIDRYGLRRKRVLEIGCGKGDFLALLCELGDNEGIGIDPTSVHDRLDRAVADRIRFVNEFYSAKHAAIDTDFLCCRHALEHVPDVAGFLATLGRAVGKRTIPIFFEVPETLRVLREAAYWDIYYEHCSYFTPGSLARLFETHDFEVSRVSVAYDDQYLMLDARRPAGLPLRRCQDVDRPEDVAAEIEAFERSIERKLDTWRAYFDHVRRQGRKIVIWGSGSKCVAFLTTIGVTDEIEYVTDVNPHRHGKFIVGAGKEIVPPAFLKSYRPDEIIVMNPIYRDEVAAAAAAMDLDARIITSEEPLEALA